MTIAIISTIISSVSMALMIVTDKLMLNQCYESKPRQAWFISSLAGSVFGLFLTIIMWGVIATASSSGTFIMLFYASVDLFFWQGLAVLIAGILGIQILFHYFNCFSEDASSASVAAWIAATPIFILLTFIIISFVDHFTGFFTILTLTQSINPIFAISVAITTFALVGFEYFSNSNKISQNKYRKSLILLIFYNVIYSILLQYILGNESNKYSHGMYVLALLPYLWIGFAAGTRDILVKNRRKEIVENWRLNIKKYWRLIFMVEIVGMFVFYFEYFGLADLNAAYVSVIIGAHVILVYLLDFLLILYLHSKHNRFIKINKNQTLVVNEPELLYTKRPLRIRIVEIVFLIIIVTGIIVTTMYV